MAYGQPAAWYTHAGDGVSTGYYAIIAFVPGAVYVAGQLVRPTVAAGVAVGNERVYVCIVAGTASTEPIWTFTKGAVQPITGTVTFQECTAEPGLNGDLSNIILWTSASNPPLGRVIYEPTSNTLQICNVSNGNGGATNGNKPVFSATAGVVTNDVNNRWTSLGLTTAWTAWKAPAPRLGIAIAGGWGSTGNDFYVADNSAEVQATAIVLNLGSITTAPCRYFSVDHTATTMPPAASALKPGASITGQLAAANAIGIGNVSNIAQYWYGFNFIVNGNAATTLITTGGGGNVRQRFESCTFVNQSANVGATVGIGTVSGSSNVVDFLNCSFTYGNTGHAVILTGGNNNFRSTVPMSFFNGTMPTAAFKQGGACTNVMEAIDFSALGANSLFLNNNIVGFWTLKNCKLHPSTTINSPALSNTPCFSVDLINTDSGTNVLRNERHNWYGDGTTSVAVTRAGGATEGGVAISHLIAAASASKLFFPFSGLPIVIWNDVIGVSRTLTIYGCSDTVSTPALNNWIWLDVEYMGSSATPLGSFVSTGLSTQLDVQVAYPADTSTWTGTINAGSRFSMSVTFTAQQKGNVYVYPRSTSSGPRFYLDPLPVLA